MHHDQEIQRQELQLNCWSWCGVDQIYFGQDGCGKRFLRFIYNVLLTILIGFWYHIRDVVIISISLS